MITPSIWIAPIIEISINQLVFLTPFDQKKLNNISNQQRKNTFLLGRYLLYQSLLHQGIDYKNYQIKYTELNKPFAQPNDFCFNISHSKDLIVLILNQFNNLSGIDCEKIRPRAYQKLMNEYFKPKEINYILEKDSLDRFYLLWTIKEAILKQNGGSILQQKNLPPLEIKEEKVKTDPKINIQSIKYADFIISCSTEMKTDFHYYDFRDNQLNPVIPKLIAKT